LHFVPLDGGDAVRIRAEAAHLAVHARLARRVLGDLDLELERTAGTIGVDRVLAALLGPRDRAGRGRGGALAVVARKRLAPVGCGLAVGKAGVLAALDLVVTRDHRRHRALLIRRTVFPLTVVEVDALAKGIGWRRSAAAAAATAAATGVGRRIRNDRPHDRLAVAPRLLHQIVGDRAARVEHTRVAAALPVVAGVAAGHATRGAGLFAVAEWFRICVAARSTVVIGAGARGDLLLVDPERARARGRRHENERL
jgi:hypothetical protein